MREEHPEGFLWTCCDQAGDEAGCKAGRHEANPEKSKKGMYEFDSEGSETAEDERGDEEDDGKQDEDQD